MPHVLVADSDGVTLHDLTNLLARARYHVTGANDGRSVIRAVANQPPDLVLLEAILPDQEGFEVCRRIRRTSDVPIVFLSSRACAEDRVLGLRLGADDYLAKPCAPAELLARVGAVLRRAERARRLPTDLLICGPWTLDPIQQICTLADGRAIELTPREVHLLSFLMRRSGSVCTTNQIVRHIWGYGGQQSHSIVATSIWRLRAKLEQDPQMPQHLLTVRNMGYRFVS